MWVRRARAAKEDKKLVYCRFVGGDDYIECWQTVKGPVEVTRSWLGGRRGVEAVQCLESQLRAVVAGSGGGSGRRWERGLSHSRRRHSHLVVAEQRQALLVRHAKEGRTAQRRVQSLHGCEHLGLAVCARSAVVACIGRSGEWRHAGEDFRGACEHQMIVVGPAVDEGTGL